jgi:hypothetical protein
MSVRHKISGVLGLGIGAYVAAVRPRMRRWGATEEEARQPYPGADLVPGGERGATMAVTIDAPPSQLWPWLVQMGCDRAGWYSWDRLDNGGVPSAERVHSEWQEISVGDHLLSSPSGNTWFVVAAVEPERFLALRASYDLRDRPFDPLGERPRVYTDSTWCFQLKNLTAGRTRLVVSGYAASRPRLFQRIQDLIFWEPAHWIMQTRQFAQLARRVETSAVANDPPRAQDRVDAAHTDRAIRSSE